jgi:hypothetical protein
MSASTCCGHSATLLDHLVGDGEHPGWNGEAILPHRNAALCNNRLEDE